MTPGYTSSEFPYAAVVPTTRPIFEHSKVYLNNLALFCLTTSQYTFFICRTMICPCHHSSFNPDTAKTPHISFWLSVNHSPAKHRRPHYPNLIILLFQLSVCLNLFPNDSLKTTTFIVGIVLCELMSKDAVSGNLNPSRVQASHPSQ
mgnify:CR=1 FL=1